MYCISKWLLALSLIACSGLSTAQSLSLKELLDKVAQNAPALATEKANVKVKESQLKDIRFGWIPALKLDYQATVGTNNNVEGAYFTMGLVPSSSGGVRAESNTQAVSGNLAIAGLDWELYNFGGYESRTKAAKSELAAQQDRYNFTAFELQEYAIQYYLELIRLKQLLDIQKRNIERNTQIKQSITSLTNSGLNPGVDTSIAEAELSKARLNYLEVENAYKQIQIHLSTLSGIKPETIAPDTTMSGKLDVQNPVGLFAAPDTQNHPLMLYYRSLYQSSLAQEKAIKHNYNPKLLLEATGWARGSSIKYNDNFQSLDNGFGSNRINYLVGLGLTYNIFDLPRMKLKLQVQKNASLVAQNQYDEQKQLLTEANANAAVEMETARRRMLEIPHQLTAANDAYTRQLNLYRNGLVNIIDLDASLNVLYRAETDYASARDAYYKALFHMAYATNQVTLLLNLF